jgi:Flp pilus assembly protein TadB
VAEDARSATAQARFTGYLVVAMPAGAALFTELIRPGFLGSLVSSPPALAVLAVSVLMQVAGFVAISRLARVGEV